LGQDQGHKLGILGMRCLQPFGKVRAGVETSAQLDRLVVAATRQPDRVSAVGELIDWARQRLGQADRVVRCRCQPSDSVSVLGT